MSLKTVKSTNKSNWDMDLNFKDTYDQLVNDYKKALVELKDGNITANRQKKLLYITIGLITLRNGLRQSEAVESLKEIILSNSDKVQVKVLKRKDNFYRSVYLPSDLQLSDLDFIKDIVLNSNISKTNVSHFFKTNYGYNPHSLRHCFVSEMIINRNIDSIVLSKITGHKNISTLVNYTSQKKADYLLKELEFSKQVIAE